MCCDVASEVGGDSLYNSRLLAASAQVCPVCQSTRPSAHVVQSRGVELTAHPLCFSCTLHTASNLAWEQSSGLNGLKNEALK